MPNSDNEKSNPKKDKKKTWTGKHPGGRPTIYSLELTSVICARISDGESIRKISKDEDMPHMSTIFRWLTLYPEFKEQYEISMQERLQGMAEELLDIADNGVNDWMERNEKDNPGYVYNGEHVQRSRLRVDIRKWFLSKHLPKVYGDKAQVEHSGEIGLRKTALVGGIMETLNTISAKKQKGE